MRNTAFFVAGLVLLFVQVNTAHFFAFVYSWLPHWMHPSGFVPSLVLPLIVFMGVHEYSLARGAGVAFVLGYLTDLIGIAPIGLYTFVSVATFVLARAAGVRLAAQTMWMQALLAFAFALVHSVMILVLLAIFGRDKDGWVPRHIYPLAIPHAISTGVIAPLVFRLAKKIHTATASAPRASAGGGPA
jgi:rod shape-determining protein MreD